MNQSTKLQKTTNKIDQSFDLIVVGGGVLGTFHAYHALEMGLKVALLERNTQPLGATVSNFGQVIPSGMNGKWQQFGRESLQIYKEIQAKFDISVRQNGSIYIASDSDEVALIEELGQINQSNGYESHLLDKGACLSKYPGLQADYVKAGLFFPEEVTVEPRVMISRLLQYLIVEKNLHYFGNTTASACNAVSGGSGGVEVITAAGQRLKASKVIICSGAEFKLLYPELFASGDLEAVKIQMLQTIPQSNYMLNGSVLTGLSIRRYEAFRECPSFSAIKSKEDPGSFEKKWGIHILFKQAVDGSVIIGDSHEYAAASDIDALGFDLKEEIDEYILQEAKKIFDLPSYKIRNRWYGIYSQARHQDIFQRDIDENIHVVTGIGGKGMTASAGFSKENIKQLLN